LLKLTFSSRLASLLLKRKIAATVFVVLGWRLNPVTSTTYACTNSSRHFDRSKTLTATQPPGQPIDIQIVSVHVVSNEIVPVQILLPGQEKKDQIERKLKTYLSVSEGFSFQQLTERQEMDCDFCPSYNDK